MLSGVYRFPQMESVVFGKPFAEALAQEVDRLDARAVFVLASGTLSRETDLVERLRQVLGNRFAGLCAKIGAHTPRIDVVAAANSARESGADLIVTLGGGSVTDAAKMVGLCLGNDVTTPEQLDDYRARIAADGTAKRPTVKPPAVRMIAIPTTLSAGEFSAGAGCTDTERHVKESFSHPQMIPRTVILDPDASVHTPEWLFLSTGIRAVDHAVEDICSVNGQPISEGAAYHALLLLGKGLPGGQSRSRGPRRPARLPDRRLDVDGRLADRGQQRREPRDRACARRHRRRAAWLHLLHHAAPRAALQSPGERRKTGAGQRGPRPARRAGSRNRRRLDRRSRPAHPTARCRRQAGAARRDRRESMHDRWVHTNPRKIDGPPVVRTLLDAAW